MKGDAEVALLGRVDVALHVLDLVDDALDDGRLVLEQLRRKLLVQPGLERRKGDAKSS